MKSSLEEHLRELQRVVRLRRAELARAWQGKENDAERSHLAIEREIIIRRLEERLYYEEVS